MLTDELTFAELEELERLNRDRTQGEWHAHNMSGIKGVDCDGLLSVFTCHTGTYDTEFTAAAANKMDKLIAAARRIIDGSALAKSIAIALHRKAEGEIDHQKFFESIMACLDTYARAATLSKPESPETNHA